MGWRTKYDVEFRGLKEGLHAFEFQIGNEFFEHFEQGLVNVGNLDVKVDFEKRSTFLKLHFNHKGWVELTCDRCLENYRQDVEHNAEIFVKFGTFEDEGDGEVLWVLHDEHKINLAQLIYEFIILSIPLKHVHPDDENGESGCNREMLDRIEELTNPDESENVDIDPRWEELKKWKNNN